MTRIRNLTRKDMMPDPVAQFQRWFKSAERSVKIELAEATCLSTIDRKGFPDGRIVLIKGFDKDGFVFFTNLDSNKGKSLLSVPRAALTFYWEPLGYQVRIQGIVRLVSDKEADEYFETRPRSSRIGAWASKQSSYLDSRLTLMREVGKYVMRFKVGRVPRPDNWSGFRLSPVKFEFWQRRLARLHDRFEYTKSSGGKWKIKRLYP